MANFPDKPVNRGEKEGRYEKEKREGGIMLWLLGGEWRMVVSSSVDLHQLYH